MKKKILASIMAVVAILVIVGCLVFLKQRNKAIFDGTVCIEVVDENGIVLKTKDIAFVDGDTTVDLVKNNFDNVEIKDGMILSIESIETPSDWSYFICIYVNDEMSSVGIESIRLENNNRISFIYTTLTYRFL